MDARYAALDERAAQSLDWIARHLERFTPLADGSLTELRLKVFSELSLAYSYLVQSPHASLRERARAWTPFMERWARAPALAQMPRKRPAVALAYLLPYLMLRATGFRCADYEDTLTRLRRSGHLRPHELVPYRIVEREHALWRSGILRREPAWKRLAAATVLLRTRSLLSLDDEGAYAITHTLFYLTDFGHRAAPLSPREMRRAVDFVEGLLLHYWRVGNWDLVGELLINANCCGACGSDIYAGAVRAYEGAWRPDGAMPPRCTSEVQDAVGGDEDFGACYHPTLVAVLYCATAMSALQSGWGAEAACAT